MLITRAVELLTTAQQEKAARLRSPSTPEVLIKSPFLPSTPTLQARAGGTVSGTPRRYGSLKKTSLETEELPLKPERGRRPRLNVKMLETEVQPYAPARDMRLGPNESVRRLKPI